ncbi:MAG: hypothetical protein WDO56_20170 [Gammaproteobacteria bacterium]
MGRNLFVCLLCLAVALIAVTGVHAHLPGDHPGAEIADPHAEGHHRHGAYVVSVIDADHLNDHDDDGDVDIDPLAKAFGTLSLSAPVAIIAMWVGIVLLAAHVLAVLVVFAPPLRPPRDRSRFYILPPSHAPPAPLV